jgi:glucan phosphoethanolaminetransferase (alkaline phosphatase superfamily)
MKNKKNYKKKYILLLISYTIVLYVFLFFIIKIADKKSYFDTFLEVGKIALLLSGLQIGAILLMNKKDK